MTYKKLERQRRANRQRLLTPTGWRVRSKMEVGDELVSELGTTVVGSLHQLKEVPLYELRFEDGTKIIAPAEQLWKTRSRQEIIIRSTSEIYKTLHLRHIVGVLRNREGLMIIDAKILKKGDYTLLEVYSDYIAQGHIIMCGLTNRG